MSCVAYNLIKEGVVTNRLSDGVAALPDAAILALYDGDVTTAATTISGTPLTVALLVEFGESYDVCRVDYYTDDLFVDNILVRYGDTDAVENTVAGTLASGVYRVEVDTGARFFEVRHTVSGTSASIYQLEIIGTKNETLGFGESVEEARDHLYLPHATIGKLSASATRVPLFNDNHFPEVARVAVAPTGTDADNYLYVAVDESGPYYGINDYGVRQPGARHISLRDDPFTGETIDSQWSLRFVGHHHIITPTPEGLFFSETLDIVEGVECTGIINRIPFTATSFTAEVDIKITGTTSLYSAYWRSLNMILTSSFPAAGVGYYASYPTDERVGGSTGGIKLTAEGGGSTWIPEDARYTFRWVDGTASSDPRSGSLENRWDGFGGGGGVTGELEPYDMQDFDDILNEGNSLADLTAEAAWHTWRVVYDHRKQQLSGYIDNIFIGSHTFGVEAFNEGCYLYIGSAMYGGFSWVLRNFRIHPNRLYRLKNVALAINGGQASATVSGTADNVAALIDDSTSTTYVGPDPTGLSRVRVAFDRPYDVVYYSLKQHDKNDSETRFGKAYYADVARVSIADFGGSGTYVHRYYNNSNHQPRSPTHSGTATTLSGIEYVEIQFTSYDETVYANGALIIDELQVFAEEYVDAVPPEEEDVLEIPWIEGKWSNLRQFGRNASLSLKDRGGASVEAGRAPWPEYFRAFVDYGFSSAVPGEQYSSAYDYPHAETLFAGVGSYAQWHSDEQDDNHIYIWRAFPEESRVRAVHWDTATLRPSYVADKFKVQYLREGGVPHGDADWVDVPPITQAHPYSAANVDKVYRDYRDYLIANNDGEYYTDYGDIPLISYGGVSTFNPGGVTGVSRPTGVVVPASFGSLGVNLSNTGSVFSDNGLTGYLEFDEAVTTRAIRFVVHTPTDVEGAEKTEIAFEKLSIFREHGAGSYTSPVFDTGTAQNTERIKTDIIEPEGTASAVFVRSWDDPPESAHDDEYEVWRSCGLTGYGSIVLPTYPSTYDRAIALGDIVYFILSSKPYAYNFLTDSWSYMGGGYPAENDGSIVSEEEADASLISPDVLPDNRVREHSVLLADGNIYTAAYDNGDVRRACFMKYRFTEYPLGWSRFGDNRLPESEYASMVAYGRRLYFFNIYGTISYYDIDDNLWIIVGAELPLNGGSSRSGFASCAWGDRAYLFGGTPLSVFSTTIFHFDTETLSVGTPAPYPVAAAQAVPVPAEGAIYIFPEAEAHTVLKYFPEEDSWEIAESLMWWRDTGTIRRRPRAPFLRGDYIYALGDAGWWARAKVARTPWTAGKRPDIRDRVWGGPDGLANIRWQRVGSLGEFMPQKRYLQVRAELYSEDRVRSPVLEGITVVTPQSVSVPASGTANVYVKVGVGADETYQAWYTGNGPTEDIWTEDDFSIIYAESKDGLEWSTLTLVSGSWYHVATATLNNAQSPWVIKEGSSYQFWFARSTITVTTYQNPTENIYYATSEDPLDLSGEVLAVGASDHAQTSKGVYHPCVLRRSPTDYRMWYTGEDATAVQRIFYATSSGGGVWSDFQLSLNFGGDTVTGYDAAQVYRPSVLEEAGVFRLWYTGVDSAGVGRVLYTTSSDGLTWGVPQVAVDINSEGGGLDRFGSSCPMVLRNDDTYVMFYLGYDGTDRYVLRATSPDGLEWFDHTLVGSSCGMEATRDTSGILDFFSLVVQDAVIPGQVLTTGKLKIHNEGAAL